MNAAEARVPLMNGSSAAKRLFYQVIEETRLSSEQSTVSVRTAQKFAQLCLAGGSGLLLGSASAPRSVPLQPERDARAYIFPEYLIPN